MTGGLACRGLEVRLGGNPVLTGVDFTLAEGGLHGLIGPNGAGKSTLLRALAGLLPPARGTLTLHGRNLADFSRVERARAMGYLPQNGTCHWPLPVARLVELGRLPHLEEDGVLSAPDREAVDTALRETDTWNLRHRPVTELSGGELARVFLARVLAGDPEILLIDEPLSGLDLYHQLQVMELLQLIARDKKKIICVVMHDLSLALRYCPRLTLLEKGRTLGTGTPDELLPSGRLERVFHVQLHPLVVEGHPALIPLRRREN